MRDERACDSDSPANGADPLPLFLLLTRLPRKERGSERKRETVGGRKREEPRNEASRKEERGKTVGLVTRCVLLLLYGGLLHHQNIKRPVGKRACAWVHPHFTFTADCRLNWATFPRFLAPENVLVRPSRILCHHPPHPSHCS